MFHARTWPEFDTDPLARGSPADVKSLKYIYATAFTVVCTYVLSLVHG